MLKAFLNWKSSLFWAWGYWGGPVFHHFGLGFWAVYWGGSELPSLHWNRD